MTMFTKYHRMGEALGVAVSRDSVTFFLKTKRSLRSDVDRPADRSTDRSTDKMATVTLWRMRTEGYDD